MSLLSELSGIVFPTTPHLCSFPSVAVTDIRHCASELVFKWQCLSKRKSVVHKDIKEIFNMFMVGSCCQLQLFHLIALCYFIKTLI